MDTRDLHAWTTAGHGPGSGMGAGPLVEGTAEALAMTMSGRTAYLDQRAGDGVPLVRDR